MFATIWERPEQVGGGSAVQPYPQNHRRRCRGGVCGAVSSSLSRRREKCRSQHFQFNKKMLCTSSQARTSRNLEFHKRGIRRQKLGNTGRRRTRCGEYSVDTIFSSIINKKRIQRTRRRQEVTIHKTSTCRHSDNDPRLVESIFFIEYFCLDPSLSSCSLFIILQHQK